MSNAKRQHERVRSVRGPEWCCQGCSLAQKRYVEWPCAGVLLLTFAVLGSQANAEAPKQQKASEVPGVSPDA